MNNTDMTDPAGNEPPPGASSGAARLARSLLHPSRSQLGVGVLLGVLMFAAVTQVRLYGDDNAYSGLRQSDLVQALSGLSAASARADTEINQLQRTRNALRNSSEQRTAALTQAKKELTTLGILAGTLPAEGPGLEIVVSDPDHQYRVNHLIDGIEALRDAGAEAMQLNGKVRVVAQTFFRDAEDGIEVDDQLLTPPYTLDVIGNPRTLSTALNFPGGFKDDVALDQGTTKVTEKKIVEVSATRAPTRPRYAQPQLSP